MAAYLAMPVYNILLCNKAILLLLKTSNHTLTNELAGSTAQDRFQHRHSLVSLLIAHSN